MSEESREIRHSPFMTSSEALMWAAEHDPHLSAAMGSVAVLDQRVDFDRFVQQMNAASLSVRRLREKVVPGLGIAPPRWVIDDDFDISDHVRRIRLPAPGTIRELLDLSAQVFQDPFDPNRPLWQFVAVGGSGSRRKDAVKGALILKLHHSVSDGIGAVRLAEMYMDLERDPPARHTVANELNGTNASQPGLLDSAIEEIGYVAGSQIDLARQAAAEVAMWGADPARIRRAGENASSVLKSLGGLGPKPSSSSSGSPLWRTRSRQRHLEVFDLNLAEVRDAAKALGGSVNDLFVAGSVIAASRYHAVRDADVQAFNLSFIISTRSDEAAGGNSFAPVPFSVEAGPLPVRVHFEFVRDAMEAKKVGAVGGLAGGLELVASVANLLPNSLISKAGRARAAGQDWATSNLRATPFPLYVAGAEIVANYPVGPLGGTAFNLTVMSYNGSLHAGLFADPQAVDSPAELRDLLVDVYDELLAEGSS